MAAKIDHPSLQYNPGTGLHELKKRFNTTKYLREYCELLHPNVRCEADKTFEIALQNLRSAVKRRYLVHDEPKPARGLEGRYEREIFGKWSAIRFSAEDLWHHLVDFQVPMKNRRLSLLGLRAIDLLAVSSVGWPIIVELKVLRTDRAGKKSADTPLVAILEAASYACVLRADWAAFREELRIRLELLGIKPSLPDDLKGCPIVIAAPDDYWDFWKKVERTSFLKAKPALRSLVQAFRVEGFPITFARIGAFKHPDALDISRINFLEP